MENVLKTTTGTIIKENKVTQGAKVSTISLSMMNIIMFRKDIPHIENCISMAMNGGNCTVHGITMEYNKRSKYINWFGLGKFKVSELQELISYGKTLITC